MRHTALLLDSLRVLDPNDIVLKDIGSYMSV